MATREVSYNLAGTVRNMGLPVAGTTIVLYDYWSTGRGITRHFVAEQTTGPRGDFSFDVRSGIYTLEVVPNRDTRFARQTVETIKVTTNTTLTVGLKHGANYSGTVRTASGDIVTGCELTFVCIEPDTLLAAESVGDDGKFSISLPKGKYYVAISQNEPSPKKRGTSFLCPSLHVLDLYDDDRDDIILPETVLFKGAVTNADGHPVSDVKVTIRPSNPPEGVAGTEVDIKSVCYTNKIGQFQCEVEPATYDLLLEPGPESHLSERSVSSILVDQARTRTYSLGAGYKLQGQVTFNGQPIENALVSIYGGKTDSSVLTDDDGWYSFSLSGGTYEFSVMAQPDSLARLPFRSLAPYTCQISLAEDTLKDVALEQGIAISGKVMDRGQAPRAGVQLALYKNTGAALETVCGTTRPIAFGITGDDGSYDFRVSPGDYFLVTNNQISTVQELEARDGDLLNDITWQTGCLLTLSVMSEADEPIANCKVTYEDYGGNAAGQQQDGEARTTATTGDDGTCAINLPAGIYTFHFEPPAHGSYEPKQIRQLSINCDMHRKIRLPLKPAAVQ